MGNRSAVLAGAFRGGRVGRRGSTGGGRRLGFPFEDKSGVGHDRAMSYGLAEIPADRRIEAPELAYLPRLPEGYRPKIGLIGAGGISEYHLRAYRAMGLDVAVVCSRSEDKARKRAEEFFPDAIVCTDYREVLAHPGVEVVDATPHPAERLPILEAAIEAGKHVLSQKPFVENLIDGQRLVRMAREAGVKLAVNQNGRWAPHFCWMRRAVEAGLIGAVRSVDFSLHWDHSWTAGTPFEEVKHLILGDFGIHWFDAATAFMGGRMPVTVFASKVRAAGQTMKPAMLAGVVAPYAEALVTMTFSALTRHGQEDRTVIAGETGTLVASGPGLNDQRVRLFTEDGIAEPELKGDWFTNGFQGTMAELICAIAEDREPENGAAGNLKSLAFCQAAMRSADVGVPRAPLL